MLCPDGLYSPLEFSIKICSVLFLIIFDFVSTSTDVALKLCACCSMLYILCIPDEMKVIFQKICIHLVSSIKHLTVVHVPLLTH